MSDAPDIEEILKKENPIFYEFCRSLPTETQSLIFRLYAFISICKNYSDSIPQQKESFFDLKDKFFDFRSQSSILFDAIAVEMESEDFIIESFVNLEGDLKFNSSWTEMFFKSIDLDLSKKIYTDFSEFNEYVSLSSGVICLYLCKIFGVDMKATIFAQRLMSSFQIIHFIQNIPKYNTLRRNYFPQQLMEKYNLDSLNYKDVVLKESQFKGFIKEIMEVYKLNYLEGLKGVNLFPKKYKANLESLLSYYQFTAKNIQENPMIVYKKQKGTSFGEAFKDFIMKILP